MADDDTLFMTDPLFCIRLDLTIMTIITITEARLDFILPAILLAILRNLSCLES